MDVRKVLEQYGIEWKEYGEHHHVTEGWINVDCPWCSKIVGSNRFLLGIDPSTGRCNCWRCGPKRLSTVLSVLTKENGKKLVRRIKLEKKRQQEEEKERKLILPKGIKELQPPHRNYLVRRGFDPDEIASRWSVKAIGLAYRYSWSLFIPVMEENKIVTWTTRRISDKVKVRYLSAPRKHSIRPIKETLYGIDMARSAIIVVEGPIDVWRIGPGAVATFGMSVTATQIARLSNFPKIFVFFDTGAIAKAKRLAWELSRFCSDVELIKSDADDPGSMSVSDVIQLRRLVFGERDYVAEQLEKSVL